MGLLDEAIREHLELKRRHGADPAELAHQEQEALGPAVREAAEVGVAEAEPEPDVVEVAEAVPEAVPTEPEMPETEPAEAEAPEPPPGAAQPAGQETAVFDVDDVFAEEEAPGEGDQEAGQEEEEGEEDVLEETPEFLQETPEHDRLWFEQKPPRDFDFDG
jgi:hypothetical protein